MSRKKCNRFIKEDGSAPAISVVIVIAVLFSIIFSVSYFGSYYIVKGMCEMAMKDNPTKFYAGCKEFYPK